MNATVQYDVIVHETIRYDYRYAMIMSLILLLLIYYLAMRKIKLWRIERQVYEMEEFYRRTMQIMKELEKDFEDRIKKAEENEDGLDMVGRTARFAEAMEKLNNVYLEAKQRTTKKKGFFGR